ncbi:MAG: glycosyltransferase [Candidatus Altiarchaeales archaeon]|nr:glycosyltransferase [Candidatus Altiarchaeales archaeon]MBD3416650.1 glycosyltransferase [Candidatus Altiarchaeales archaeon]
MVSLTCVVPAYDEEGLDDVLSGIHRALEGFIDYEVIVVDDGSHEPVEVDDEALIRHPYNMGYGAAVKTGLLRSNGDRVLIIDADGTYPAERIPSLLEGDYDMVVGSRTGDEVSIPLVRRPAKWLLTSLAKYLSGFDIPDLNSGLRVFRRELALEFLHLYPRGFSFTTTITLAFLCNDYTVKYVPIDYHSRSGDSKSKISPLSDGFGFLLLILRTILYFNPLKVFMPLSALMLSLAGLVFMYSTMVLGQVMDITVTSITVTAVEVALFGLLADLVVKRAR